MTLYQPLWAQNNVYPALADRLLMTAVFEPGVRYVGDLLVTQRLAGTAMAVNIAGGTCVIPGPANDYLCLSDAIEERPITAAPAAGTSRVDLVIARVYDPQATGVGSGEAFWDIEVVTGAPATSNPPIPAAPAHSIRLAEVRVAAGLVAITNSHITDVRTNAIPGEVMGPLAVAISNTARYATTTTAITTASATFRSGPGHRTLRVGVTGTHERGTTAGLTRSMAYLDGRWRATWQTRHDTLAGPGGQYGSAVEFLAVAPGVHTLALQCLNPNNSGRAYQLAGSSAWVEDAGPATGIAGSMALLPTSDIRRDLPVEGDPEWDAEPIAQP